MSRLALLATLAVVTGCGDDDPGKAVRVAAGFTDDAPAYLDVPFPTDAVMTADGHLGTLAGLEAVTSTYADLVAAHVATLDGWGLRPVIEFPIQGGPIDATTLPATTRALTDPIFVIALDGSNTVVPFDWKYDDARNVIAGHPVLGAQLAEGAHYAAVVTAAVRPLVAWHPVSSADRWQTTAAARAMLQPLVAEPIAGMAVFTTGHHSAGMLAARAAMDAPGVPGPSLVFDDPAIVFDTPAKLQQLLGDATKFTTGPRTGQEHWGTDDPDGVARAHIAAVATGKLSIVRFRGDDTHTDGPDDETFHFDASGAPQIVATETIPLTIILPKGPMPAAGYPVVIFAHGLGSSRIWALNLAEPLTSQGYAVVAIDIFGHGSRYSAADVRNNLGGKPGFTGVKTMPDGFGDDVGQVQVLDFFEGFLNVSAIRDSIRQSALDFTRVAELVADPALDLSALAAATGGVTPRLDASKLAYLGESFGTIVGTLVAAIAPDLIHLFILDVPGGGLLDQILPNSPAVSTLALSFISTAYATHGALDKFHPLVGLLQAVFDPGDPLTFAPLAPAATTVLAIEVSGDETMSNPSTASLAHGFGMSLLAPSYDATGFTEVPSPVTGGAPRVLVQYAPATHGYNWAAEHGPLSFVPGFPHADTPDDPFPELPATITIGEPIYETQDQVAQLLASYRAGAPTIVSTLAPRHDFDDDGKPDDSDPAPYDPNN